MTRELLSPDLPIRIFFVSSSGIRLKNWTRAVEKLGIEARVHKGNGPMYEVGASAVDRAAHKTLAAHQRLIRGGYFGRHPGGITFIVAADSRNWDAQNGWVDKPATLDAWRAQEEQWLQMAADPRRLLFSRSGYAVRTIVGSKNSLVTGERTLLTVPPPARVLSELFHSDDNFEFGQQTAGGLPTAKLVMQRQLLITTTDGKILYPQQAVHELYGADATVLESALVGAVRRLHLGSRVNKPA